MVYLRDARLGRPSGGRDWPAAGRAGLKSDPPPGNGGPGNIREAP